MKYQVMPDLTPIEYEALKADIAEHGVLVPVEVDENGEMLDGHHRVKAWQELREEGREVAKYPTMTRTGWSEEQKRNHARRLNVLRRQLTEEQQTQVRADMKRDGMSYPAIAAATGASVGKVYAEIQEVFKNENLTIPPTIGIDGKIQSSTKKPRKPAPPQQSIFSPGGAVALDPKAAEATVKEIRQESSAPHVANNSGNNEWYTPPEYIEAARRVLGTIDLDPASSDEANTVVKADRYYTTEGDGLAQAWKGRVWMNPPYASDLVSRFTEKLSRAFDVGDVTEAVVLVNNGTETQWFQALAFHASAICFPCRRVRFWSPDGGTGAPLQGQAILYLGGNTNAFIDHFQAFGLLVRVA